MAKGIKIRKATKEDIPFLKQLEKSAQSKNKKKELFKYYLKKRGIFVSVNRETQKITGFSLSQMLSWVNGFHKIVWIEHIYIDPREEDSVAKKLMEHIEDYYKALVPDVVYIFGNLQPSNKKVFEMVSGLQTISFFGKV